MRCLPHGGAQTQTVNKRVRVWMTTKIKKDALKLNFKFQFSISGDAGFQDLKMNLGLVRFHRHPIVTPQHTVKCATV
jgi:hypothetical protein